MIRSETIHKTDLWGALAGSVCLIHCMITPFLFIAKACTSSCCSESPLWWQAVDYVFILISLIAIKFVTNNISHKGITIAFWTSWILLLVTTLDGTLQTGLLPHSFIYLPALAIIGLHFYNMKYSQCSVPRCVS